MELPLKYQNIYASMSTLGHGHRLGDNYHQPYYGSTRFMIETHKISIDYSNPQA